PLSAVMGTPAPPLPPPLGPAPDTPQSVGTAGGGFFDELGDALAVDPPGSEFDAGMLQTFAALGIGPGEHPYAKAMAASDATTTAALDAGVSEGMARITAPTSSPAAGWTVLDVGAASTDTLLRATVANVEWGANLLQEA